MRGITGAVLMCTLVKDESADVLAEHFTSAFTSDQLADVVHIATDAPSRKLLQTVRRHMPNLVWVSLDPTHIAMLWESAHSHKHTRGSSCLRLAMQRFCCIDTSLTADEWGAPFEGEHIHPSSRESLLIQHVRDGSMSLGRARAILRTLEDEAHLPYYSQSYFIEVMAAVSAVHRDEATVRAPSGKNIAHHLAVLCSPTRVQWLFNLTRFRHTLDVSSVRLMPSGTTSNEAFHRELNAWFRACVCIRRDSLRTKLKAVSLGKLLTHNSALYSSGLRQSSQQLVLARGSAGLNPWTPRTWAKFIGELEPSLPAPRSRIIKRPICIFKRPSVKTNSLRDGRRGVFRLRRKTRLLW